MTPWVSKILFRSRVTLCSAVVQRQTLASWQLCLSHGKIVARVKKASGLLYSKLISGYKPRSMRPLHFRLFHLRSTDSEMPVDSKWRWKTRGMPVIRHFNKRLTYSSQKLLHNPDFHVQTHCFAPVHLNSLSMSIVFR